MKNDFGLMFGEFGGHSGGFIGFSSRMQRGFDVVACVLGNLGFAYDLRTGVLHVRIMSSLKG